MLVNWLRRKLGIERMEKLFASHVAAEENKAHMGVDIGTNDAVVAIFDSGSRGFRIISVAFSSSDELDKLVGDIQSVYGVPARNTYIASGVIETEDRWQGRSPSRKR